MTVMTRMPQRAPSRPPRERSVRLREPAPAPAPARKRGPKGGWEPYRDWFAILVVTHATLLTVALTQPPAWAVPLVGVVLGGELATGLLTVLHDAGHQRFSHRRSWLNVGAVHTAVPIGFWVGHWGLKHRVHHKATSVYPLDEATRASFLVRFHSSAPLHRIHRYQHLYVWFLYGLTWAGEFKSQLTFLADGMIAGQKTPAPFRRRLVSYVVEKALWLAALTPYALLWSPAMVAWLWFCSVTAAGVFAACVLIVGHVNVGVNSGTTVPTSQEWHAHLVRATANFNLTSPTVRWLTGAMSHHVAHHLRPMAPRDQLPRIHDTVAVAVAAEVGEPMRDFPTFRSAVRGHARRLRELGRPETDPTNSSAGVVAASRL